MTNCEGLDELVEVIEASCREGDAHDHSFLPKIMSGILYATGLLTSPDEPWNSYIELSAPHEQIQPPKALFAVEIILIILFH